MNTKEAVKSLQEYVSVPLAELVESSNNPRKTFDEAKLEELAASIRSKGVLSPLLARKVNGHFEIVSGARRYRAAQSVGLPEVPVRIVVLDDAEILKTQIIENIQRADVHPFEEAQGFRALLEREGAGYTIEKVAAKTGKAAAYIAKRLRLLALIPPVAEAFTAAQIGIEHALLIAKLGADAQEKALAHCFDGYYAANDTERSLVPASRLQAWIDQNVYLAHKSVPFSKDDETLVPEAGSCTNCPKRTGFNTLLFSEVREDSCADAACFNRKLDAHIAQRVTKMPNLVQISENYNATGETPILARRNYSRMVRALVYSQLYRAVAGHQASSGSSEDQAHSARWRFRSRTLSRRKRILPGTHGPRAQKNVNRIRFWNPFIPGIRFTVGTGLQIIVGHERRHLLQAERVLHSPSFPH